MANLPSLPEYHPDLDDLKEIRYIEILDNSQTGTRVFRDGILLLDEVETWLKSSSIGANSTATRIIFSVQVQYPQPSPPPPSPYVIASTPAFSTRTPSYVTPNFVAVVHPPPESKPEFPHQHNGPKLPPKTARRASFQPSRVAEKIRDTIIASMSLPPSYSRILQRGLAASMRIVSPQGPGGFILQCRPVGDWHFSLAAATSLPGNVNGIFVHGLQEHEFWTLNSEIKDPDYRHIPAYLSVPLILIGKRADNAADALRDSVVSLKQIQKYLEDDDSEGIRVEYDRLFRLDLRKTTSQITSLSSELAYYKAESRVGIEMLGILKTYHSGNSERTSLFNKNITIEELVSYFNSMDIEAERYGRSADAQRQTVYALIAQRDNMLNMQGTQASLRIAESSRAESNAMKVIAQSTAQDSASMSVVTTITAVFLPGTFIATLFSTSFFNFQPSSPGRHVSSWIWLYCCITLLLTIFILSIWWFFSRRRRQRITESLRMQKKDLSLSAPTAPPSLTESSPRTASSTLTAPSAPTEKQTLPVEGLYDRRISTRSSAYY